MKDSICNENTGRLTDSKSVQERFVRRLFTSKLQGKVLIWSKYVRIFCDGGRPFFRWIPRLRLQKYAKHWGLFGFAIYIFGREVNFSFGEDKKGLYSDCA